MDFLKKLLIHTDNPGVSTGNKWLPASGEKLRSFSLLMEKKSVPLTYVIKKVMTM